MKPKRRWEAKPRRRALGRGVVLASNHPAIVERRPLFAHRMGPWWPGERILVPAENNRKIASGTEKGGLRFQPIYTVTLRERADCPDSCPLKASGMTLAGGTKAQCMGNNMHWSRRFEIDGNFFRRVRIECRNRQLKYPDGFGVRLHVLGDFVSLEYVNLWAEMLATNTALWIYGYTAWRRNSEIGKAIQAVTQKFGWQRFAIRFSLPTDATPEPRTCKVLSRVPKPDEYKVDGFIVCPEPHHPEISCGTCRKCWISEKPIGWTPH